MLRLAPRVCAPRVWASRVCAPRTLTSSSASIRRIASSSTPKSVLPSPLKISPLFCETALFATSRRVTGSILFYSVSAETQKNAATSSETPLVTTETKTQDKQHNSNNNGGEKKYDDRWESEDMMKTYKLQTFWLFGVCFLIFVTVVVGGLTRLTKSGLSMVEWKPHGFVPPLTKEDWEAEFAKYKQFPEFKRDNPNMTLDEFKSIFWWEWGHRQLGRTIGLVFGLPMLYWLARGRVHPQFKTRYLALFGLGGVQGMIGWWMVKSGLDEKTIRADRDVRVSPYRLAVHLLSAFAVYSLTFITGLRHLQLAKPHLFAGIPAVLNPSLRKSATGLSHLIYFTAASGAFVAGNGAGLVYNEFPKMGGRWIPDDYVDPHLQPSWRNSFENHTAVQFHHRILGMSTWAATTAFWLYARKQPMSNRSRDYLNLMGGLATLQASLGIATLLTLVPLPLASAHQAGSLALLTSTLLYMHSLGPKNIAARQQWIQLAQKYAKKS